MRKTFRLMFVTLIVGVVLGFAIAESFSPPGSVDLLAEHPNTVVSLDSPLALDSASGNRLQLPAGTLLGLKSVYQDEVSAELRIVGLLSAIRDVSTEIEQGADHTYYLD